MYCTGGRHSHTRKYTAGIRLFVFRWFASTWSRWFYWYDLISERVFFFIDMICIDLNKVVFYIDMIWSVGKCFFIDMICTDLTSDQGGWKRLCGLPLAGLLSPSCPRTESRGLNQYLLKIDAFLPPSWIEHTTISRQNVTHSGVWGTTDADCYGIPW